MTSPSFVFEMTDWRPLGLPDAPEDDIKDDSALDEWDSPYFNESSSSSSFRGKKKTGFKKVKF